MAWVDIEPKRSGKDLPKRAASANAIVIIFPAFAMSDCLAQARKREPAASRNNHLCVIKAILTLRSQTGSPRRLPKQGCGQDTCQESWLPCSANVGDCCYLTVAQPASASILIAFPNVMKMQIGKCRPLLTRLPIGLELASDRPECPRPVSDRLSDTTMPRSTGISSNQAPGLRRRSH